jgi:hypothetical protein
MRTWLRRNRAACALVVVLPLLALSGCGHDPRAGAGAPADAGHCNDLPFLHSDPGVVVGTHWSSDRHDWGDAVPVYACVDPKIVGSARLSATDARIRIRPALVRLGTSATGVYRFEVIASRGSSGTLQLRVEGSDAFEGDAGGPRVAADGDGWHFAVPTQ